MTGLTGSMLADTTSHTRWLVLDADDGRTPQPLNVVGESVLLKVGPADSAGAFAAFHLVAPPMSGPPRHVHTREDEWFYVLDGAVVFEIDGARHTVNAGGSVYLRRGVAHAYQNFTDRDARLLIVTTPGHFAGLFEEMSAAAPPGAIMAAPEVLEEMNARYGITFTGPPMST